MSSASTTSFFTGNKIQQRAAVIRTVVQTPIRAAQSLQGKVISTANAKSAVVAVDTLIVDPVYKKRVKSTTKYTAHDEEEKCKVGDIVTLAPSRPLSKQKRFVISEIVQTSE